MLAEAKRFTRTATAAALIVVGIGAAGVADGHFETTEYTHGDGCSGRVDPITVVFFGANASAFGAKDHTEHHSPLHNEDGSGQNFYDHSQCHGHEEQTADSGVGSTRHHIRFGEMRDRDRKNRRITFGTPHFEDFTDDGDCNFPGNHAVRGNDDEGGSGFDRGRRNIVSEFTGEQGHEIRDHTDWGNTLTTEQCDGEDAGSNGTVAWITIP